jgi:hypothetical protein
MTFVAFSFTTFLYIGKSPTRNEKGIFFIAIAFSSFSMMSYKTDLPGGSGYVAW